MTLPSFCKTPIRLITAETKFSFAACNSNHTKELHLSSQLRKGIAPLRILFTLQHYTYTTLAVLRSRYFLNFLGQNRGHPRRLPARISPPPCPEPSYHYAGNGREVRNRPLPCSSREKNRACTDYPYRPRIALKSTAANLITAATVSPEANCPQ